MKILRGFKLGMLSVTMAIALLLGVHSNSHAALVSLSLSDGPTTVVINDNVGPDLNPAVGAITYIGAVGATWTTNISTALIPPNLGAPNMIMDLNSVNSSVGAGTLTIIANQTGITPGGTINFSGGVGGTFGGTAVFSWFAGGNLLGTETLGPGPDSGGGSAIANVPTPYNAVLQAVITHPTANSSSFNQDLRVSEPTTLILLGLGLASLGILGRRKFKKNI